MANKTQAQEVQAQEVQVVEQVQEAQVQEAQDAQANPFDAMFNLVDESVVVKTAVDVTKEVIATGRARLYRDMEITSITNTDKYATLVLNKNVLGLIDSGTRDAFDNVVLVPGATNVVTLASFVVTSAIKRNSKIAFISNTIAKAFANTDDTTTISVYLTGAKVDLLVEFVPANTPFVNYFSRDSTPKVFDHNVVIYRIVDIKLGESGITKVNNLLK